MLFVEEERRISDDLFIGSLSFGGRPRARIHRSYRIDPNGIVYDISRTAQEMGRADTATSSHGQNDLYCAQ